MTFNVCYLTGVCHTVYWRENC